MSARNSRREIDKAVKHLMAYSGPNAEWEGRLEEVVHNLLDPVARKLGVDFEELEEFFFSGPYQHMFFGFAFEEYATVLWDNEKHNLIDTYLKHRGWRESPAGRRYLQALSQSMLEFWEITAVSPGAYVELRRYGSQDKPIRIKEKAGTEGLHQWDGLAARVLKSGANFIFSGSILPFKPELATRIQSILSCIPDNTRKWIDELIAQGDMDAPSEKIDELIRLTLESELAGIAFQIWALDVYVQTFQGAPSLRNMDDEPFLPTTVKFPLKASPAEIARALDDLLVLHRDLDDTDWCWFPVPYEDIDFEEQVSILGHVCLRDDFLELHTNSTARAERGRDLLSTYLSNHVGTPLTIHDTEPLRHNVAEVSEPMSEIPPEIEDAIHAQLTSHYRKTLDEPTPMLNDLSPRECAADPALHNDVINWLKHLENSNDRSPGIGYDFQWIWDELKLKRQ